jgi:hypothetical protein
MNFLLTLGGYDWTIVKLEDRADYLSSLKKASIDHLATLFAEFVLMSMQQTGVDKSK